MRPGTLFPKAQHQVRVLRGRNLSGGQKHDRLIRAWRAFSRHLSHRAFPGGAGSRWTSEERGMLQQRRNIVESPHAFKAIDQLLPVFKNSVGKERRNAVITRPAVHARVLITLEEIAVFLDASQRLGILPGAFVEARQLPSLVEPGIAFPSGVGHNQGRLCDLKRRGHNFEHQAVALRGHHRKLVAAGAQLSGDINRQHKGANPFLGIMEPIRQLLSVKVNHHPVGARGIERRDSRSGFQRKGFSEVQEGGFPGVTFLATPNVLLGQGGVDRRLKRRRGDVESRIRAKGRAVTLGKSRDGRLQ